MAKVTPVPAPMEALLAAELPDGDGWQYEPKWDGFRCLARRVGDEVTLTSKSGKPLGRYFPDVVELLAGVKDGDFLLDGELIIPVGDALSFEALQLRLHPAESRVRKLAAEHPAELMLFDAARTSRQGFDRPAAREAPRRVGAILHEVESARTSPVAGHSRSRYRAALARTERRRARWGDRQAHATLNIARASAR